MKSKISVGDAIPIPKAQPRPVFIVGMNGSGTSMLADCLGQHPELFATPWETKLIPQFALTIDRYGNLDNDDNFLKLWKAVLCIPVLSQINGWTPVKLPRNWANFPRNLPAIIDGIFRTIALRYNKERWAEKTPQYVQHLTTLNSIFPAAKFIHIVRDGRDCAASFHRRWQRTPEYTIYRWKRVLHEGRQHGPDLGDNYLQLTYEDLTNNPEVWMRQVCSFLDLSFDRAVLRSNQFHREGVKKGTPGTIQPNSERWKTYFDAKQIRSLESIAGETLFQSGYEPMYMKGNHNPISATIFYWKAKDWFTEFFDMSARKLAGKSEKVPWSRIFSRAVTAIKQSRINRF